MFTLRIIFVGLVAVVANDPDPGMTAVALDMGNHRAFALLLEGTCAGGDRACVPAQYLPMGAGGFRPPLQWDLHDLSVALDGDTGIEWLGAVGRSSMDGDFVAMPRDSEEVADYSWLPHLNWIFENFGVTPKLHPDCLVGKGECCHVQARFRLPAGTVSTCHLAHDFVLRLPFPTSQQTCVDFDSRTAAIGANRIFKFDIGPYYDQALGDAVMLETEVAGSRMVMRAWDNEFWPPSGDPKAEVELFPVDGELTLVVVNEPIVSAPNHGEFATQLKGLIASIPGIENIAEQGYSASGLLGGASLQKNWQSYADSMHSSTSNSHFGRFYDMFDWSTVGRPPNLPSPVLHADKSEKWSHPGACEPYVECLDSLLFWDLSIRKASPTEANPIKYVFPHAASQCDVATYP